MPIFDYRAIDADGHAVTGRLDAANLADLEMRLKRMELDLVDGAP
jgi:type IV pilus assembly protein PilC